MLNYKNTIRQFLSRSIGFVELISLFEFIFLEIINRIKIVTSDPKILEKNSGIKGKKTIEIAENSVVPLAIPKVYGVINSFLKTI